MLGLIFVTVNWLVSFCAYLNFHNGALGAGFPESCNCALFACMFSFVNWVFVQRGTWLLSLFRAHRGGTRHFAAYECFHSGILVYQLVRVIKPGRFCREHARAELVSGSAGLSMKGVLYFGFDVFDLCFP